MSPAPCGASAASGSIITSPINRTQPRPPAKTTITAAMTAARRADRPRKSRRASENTSRARAAASTADWTTIAGTEKMPAASARIAAWKSANQ